MMWKRKHRRGECSKVENSTVCCNTSRKRLASAYSRGTLGIVTFFFFESVSFSLFAQNPISSSNPQLDANRLPQDVFRNEIDAQIHDQSLWSYLELKEEHGKKMLYAVCQTKDGEIDRLLAVNGQELNPKERKAEDRRIQKMLNHPDQMRKKQKERHEDARQAENLLKMFPEAFRFQYDGTQGGLTKLKFTPNPNFHPSGRPAHVFHHMEGSLLVDDQQKRLAEINGQLTSAVNFFGGLLGHLDKGGTFLVKQRDLGSGHWELTTMDVQMNGKALFFKTIAVREKETNTNFHQVPDGITLQQAFDLLQKDANSGNIHEVISNGGHLPTRCAPSRTSGEKISTVSEVTT